MSVGKIVIDNNDGRGPVEYVPAEGQGDGEPGWYIEAQQEAGTAPQTYYFDGVNLEPQRPGEDLFRMAGDPTLGKDNALSSYMDWVAWQREELEGLIEKYRTEAPLQIAAYKDAAYSALPEAEKNMWGDMYTNLHQRGLADSSSFLGGAKQDLSSWLAGEKSTIEDTALGMEESSQQAILSALGTADYGQLYDSWVSTDQQLQEYYDAEKRKRGV